MTANLASSCGQPCALGWDGFGFRIFNDVGCDFAFPLLWCVRALYLTVDSASVA
jgi:hypothetical protein